MHTNLLPNNSLRNIHMCVCYRFRFNSRAYIISMVTPLDGVRHLNSVIIFYFAEIEMTMTL